MKKEIYNEQTGISYTLHGNYYLPNLMLPKEDEKPIGMWGWRHLEYIKQYRKARYTTLLANAKLNAYLADINEQAENMLSLLVDKMVIVEGMTEEFKSNNQMEWVTKMNSIRKSAEEIVYHNIIYN